MSDKKQAVSDHCEIGPLGFVCDLRSGDLSGCCVTFATPLVRTLELGTVDEKTGTFRPRLHDPVFFFIDEAPRFTGKANAYRKVEGWPHVIPVAGFGAVDFSYGEFNHCHGRVGYGCKVLNAAFLQQEGMRCSVAMFRDRCAEPVTHYRAVGYDLNTSALEQLAGDAYRGCVFVDLNAFFGALSSEDGDDNVEAGSREMLIEQGMLVIGRGSFGGPLRSGTKTVVTDSFHGLLGDSDGDDLVSLEEGEEGNDTEDGSSEAVVIGAASTCGLPAAQIGVEAAVPKGGRGPLDTMGTLAGPELLEELEGGVLAAPPDYPAPATAGSFIASFWPFPK